MSSCPTLQPFVPGNCRLSGKPCQVVPRRASSPSLVNAFASSGSGRCGERLDMKPATTRAEGVPEIPVTLQPKPEGGLH